MERSPFRIVTNGHNNARHLLDQDCKLLVLQNSGKWTLQAVWAVWKCDFTTFHNTLHHFCYKNPFFKTSPGTFRKPSWLPRKLCEWPELLWICGRCTQFCGFSEFVEDFLANFWRKNFTMARLTTKISFARQWYLAKHHEIFIYTYVHVPKLSALSLFLHNHKKTEHIRNSSVTSFFKPKKAHGRNSQKQWRMS